MLGPQAKKPTDTKWHGHPKRDASAAYTRHQLPGAHTQHSLNEKLKMSLLQEGTVTQGQLNKEKKSEKWREKSKNPLPQSHPKSENAQLVLSASQKGTANQPAGGRGSHPKP